MNTFAGFFPVGQARAGTNGSLDGSLGTIYIAPNGNIYRLCKNVTALASAASKGLVTAYSAGAPTWKVDLAGAAVTEDIVFVPVGQVGSGSTSTTLAADDYFWGLVSGSTSFLAVNTTLVKTAGQSLSVSSLGLVAAIAAVTTASTVSYPGSSIQATNTVAATAAGLAITGVVAGLI